MTQEHQHERVAGSTEAEWVLSELEEDQLVEAKITPVPRRRLKGGELLLLWALRIYLVFMMVVVFWQAWTATR